MNLGKLTNIVSSVIRSRKDKTNKITQLAMAINGTYVEDTTYSPADEKPTVTAPIFDSVDLTDETVSSSQFQLGDNIIHNVTDNDLMSPYMIFLTAEQYSKMNISVEIPLSADYTQEDVLSEVVISDSDTLSGLIADVQTNLSFLIPENIACVINTFSLVDVIFTNAIMSFTITYDGVDYVYDSTNVLIIQDDEEPNAPTFYSAVFNSETGVTTSEYTLGDNLVASDENDGTSLSPALLLLTSELAQNMSVSVATTNNSSSSVSPETILNIADSMSVKEMANFADIDISSISSFISEHNITHVVSFMGIYDCFAPSMQGTSDEVLSSFTITYNGNSYTYGFDNFTFNVGQ